MYTLNLHPRVAKITLQAFEEQILGLKLVEEVGIDDKYGVIKNVAEGRANNEELATIFV